MKKNLLFSTLIFYLVFITGFKLSNDSSKHQNCADLSASINREHQGIDPTPLPPEPLPNLRISKLDEK